jgi:hypothetical protein
MFKISRTGGKGMNERFKQLAEQAKSESSNWIGSKPATTITYNELEKFAELIVRACAEFVGQQRNDIPALGWEFEAALKQHFGVRE